MTMVMTMAMSSILSSTPTSYNNNNNNNRVIPVVRSASLKRLPLPSTSRFLRDNNHGLRYNLKALNPGLRPRYAFTLILHYCMINQLIMEIKCNNHAGSVLGLLMIVLNQLHHLLEQPHQTLLQPQLGTTLFYPFFKKFSPLKID